MTSLLERPDLLEPVVASGRPRAIAAGVDANEYDAITAALTSASQWPAAFGAAGAAHRDEARAADADGRSVSAAEANLRAAACWHVATTLPSGDVHAHTEAGNAMVRALDVLRPDARQLVGERFHATLTPCAGNPQAPLVAIVPGLDSSRVEFYANAAALHRRGLATLAIDGPGQGTLAPTTVLGADYDAVVHEALNVALGTGITPRAIGLMALSLGGYYGALTLAREPRLTAGVTVSGPSRLSYAQLPGLLREILTLRAGSEPAAIAFAEQVDVSPFAADILQPLLVVDGELDVIAGYDNGRMLATLAPHGEHLIVPAGDHLVGNRRWQWLPQAADFLQRAL